MSEFLVVGCSDCDTLWVTRRDTADTTECSRCLKTWDKDSRQPLATAESRSDAADKRGQLLRERWSG